MPAKQFFDELPSHATPERLAGIENSYLFDIEGEGKWLVAIHDGKLTVTENPTEGADVVIATSSQVFDRLAAGEQNPMTAYMTGKIKVDGDIGAAMKLKKLF